MHTYHDACACTVLMSVAILESRCVRCTDTVLWAPPRAFVVSGGPSPAYPFPGGNSCKKKFAGGEELVSPVYNHAGLGVASQQCEGRLSASTNELDLISLQIQLQLPSFSPLHTPSCFCHVSGGSPRQYSMLGGNPCKIFFGGGAGITTLCSPPFSLPPLT